MRTEHSHAGPLAYPDIVTLMPPTTPGKVPSEQTLLVTKHDGPTVKQREG